MVSPTASSGSSSLHVQGARGPKSRRVEVGYQSLLVSSLNVQVLCQSNLILSFQVVVTTESLCLIGATWVHSKITQPSGAVVRVWKHQLPDPSADGAPARLDPKDQPLGWGSWQPGICVRRRQGCSCNQGELPFITGLCRHQLIAIVLYCFLQALHACS